MATEPNGLNNNQKCGIIKRKLLKTICHIIVTLLALAIWGYIMIKL